MHCPIAVGQLNATIFLALKCIGHRYHFAAFRFSLQNGTWEHPTVRMLLVTAGKGSGEWERRRKWRTIVDDKRRRLSDTGTRSCT